MTLRKINSYLSLATTALFVIHLSIMCLLLSMVIPYMQWYKASSFLLLIVTVAHAVLSTILLFMKTKENDQRHMFWNNNTTTLMLRILGFLMLVMTFLHVKDGANMFMYQVAYIAVASGHLVLSFPRALLTIGKVKSEEVYKKIQIISMVLGIVFVVWAGVSYGIYSVIGR